MPLLKKEFICSSEKYESKEGEKTAWHRIGEIVTIGGKNGGSFKKLKLYANPSVTYNVFTDDRDRKRENGQQQQQQQTDSEGLPF